MHRHRRPCCTAALTSIESSRSPPLPAIVRDCHIPFPSLFILEQIIHTARRDIDEEEQIVKTCGLFCKRRVTYKTANVFCFFLNNVTRLYISRRVWNHYFREFCVCEFRNCHTTSQLRETPRDSLSDYDRAYIPRGPATDGRTMKKRKVCCVENGAQENGGERKRRRSRPRKRNGEERRLNLTGVKLTLVGSPCIQYGDFLIESG